MADSDDSSDNNYNLDDSKEEDSMKTMTLNLNTIIEDSLKINSNLDTSTRRTKDSHNQQSDNEQKLLTSVKTKFFRRSESLRTRNLKENPEKNEIEKSQINSKAGKVISTSEKEYRKSSPALFPLRGHDETPINAIILSGNTRKAHPIAKVESEDSESDDVNLSKDEKEEINIDTQTQKSKQQSTENVGANTQYEPRRNSGILKRLPKSFLSEESISKEKIPDKLVVSLITNITNISTTNINQAIPTSEEDVTNKNRRFSGYKRSFDLVSSITNNHESKKIQMSSVDKEITTNAEDKNQKNHFMEYVDDDKLTKEKSENLEEEEVVEVEEEEEDEEDDIIYEDPIDENLESSFLKEMLLETKRHFIKDKQNTEDKIKESAACAFFSMISQKIKNANLYSFLSLKNFQKAKYRASKIPLVNCIKIYSRRRTELLRNFLRKMKNHCEISKLNTIVKVLDIYHDLDSQNDINEIIKNIYEKILKYLEKHKLPKSRENSQITGNVDQTFVKPSISNTTVTNSSTTSPKLFSSSQIEQASAPTIPESAINNKIPGVPSIPAIPGVPSTIPGIPRLPSTIPGIPGVPSIPGIPGVPSIPGIPGVPSIPGIPGVPSIPGIPGGGVPSSIQGIPSTIPGIPGVPSIPGIGGVPGVPRIPGLLPQGGNTQVVKEYPKPPKDLLPKKLFWTHVPKAKLHSTFWLSLKVDPIVDYENLNKYFCEPKKKEEEKKSEYVEEAQKSSANIQITIRLLDDKRQMNLAIALAKVPFKTEELRAILEEFDREDKLGIEMVDKIISLSPNPEEIDKLRNYNGDLNLISQGERFCKMLTTIDDFQKKLEFLKYKKSNETEKKEIVYKLKILKDSLNSIKASDHFLSVMKIILGIGNYLNADTNKGNAQGVLISTIGLLDVMKGFGKEKYSLLDVLVVNIKSKEPSLINFYTEFSKLEESTQIDQADLESKIKDFENGLNKIKKEKDVISKQKGTVDTMKYQKFLNDLELSARDKFDEIVHTNELLQKEIEAAVSFFGEDQKQFKLIEFLKLIQEFVSNYKNSLQKISAEEVKLLKKIIKDEKNKHSNIKDKYAKEFDKIRQTVTRKTLARKTLKKKDNIFNKDKVLECVNEDRAMLTHQSCKETRDRTSNPIIKHSLVHYIRHSDKTERMKIMATLDEDLKSSKSPVKIILPESRTQIHGRVTKSRITNFKRNHDEDFVEEEEEDNIDNDFIMINHPLKMNKLNTLNQAHKNLFNRSNVRLDQFGKYPAADSGKTVSFI